MEQKIKDYLHNLYENYLLDRENYIDRCYKAKCLGAMETLLVLLGIIRIGVPYEYRRTKRKAKFLFFWNINIPSRETYEEHILRLAYETLKKDHESN